MVSTFDADSCDLASVTVLPTEEKSRSDCAELAEIANTRRATVDSIGYSVVVGLLSPVYQWSSST